MQRRVFLRSAGLMTACGSVAGCLGRNVEMGRFATYVSDQPGHITDFQSCVVTIDELRILPASAATATEEREGEELLFVVDDVEADLVSLTGDASALAYEQDIATGEYAYLKLSIASVDARLEDGGEATVETPGAAPLKFNRSFKIREDLRTEFTADFTPVRQGESGRYLLQPVASETTVRYR